MPSVEERLAYLEGQVSEHAHAFVDIRDTIRQLEHRMDTRFDVVERRFDVVERRFEAIDRRFEGVDARFEALDQKISRQFVWLVGMQVTTLAAVVGAMASVVAVLVTRS